MNNGSRYVRRLIHIARSALFVSSCALCEAELVLSDETHICRECRDDIWTLPAPWCSVCGRPFGNPDLRCGECLLEEPPFDKHISYGGYEGALRELILKYKYGQAEKLKHLLVRLYIDVFHREIAGAAGTVDYIVPAPADTGRRRAFDPIRQMAAIVAKQLGVKLLTRKLLKVRETLPQAGLSRSQRLNNLNRAFAWTAGAPSPAGKTILLMDDVYTTGATIRQCSRVLVKEKARVFALTLARSL